MINQCTSTLAHVKQPSVLSTILGPPSCFLRSFKEHWQANQFYFQQASIFGTLYKSDNSQHFFTILQETPNCSLQSRTRVLFVVIHLHGCVFHPTPNRAINYNIFQIQLSLAQYVNFVKIWGPALGLLSRCVQKQLNLMLFFN